MSEAYTEAAIERAAEAEMDALDARLMRGALSQSEYDAAVRALDARVSRRHRRAAAARAAAAWSATASAAHFAAVARECGR